MNRRSIGGIPRGLLLAIALAISGCDEPVGGSAPVALDPSLTRTYLAACAECHARPGIGAPLTGVEADWRERRKKGMDGLLESTVAGYRGMPPLGTCGFCSVDDFRKLIAYMAGAP